MIYNYYYYYKYYTDIHFSLIVYKGEATSYIILYVLLTNQPLRVFAIIYYYYNISNTIILKNIHQSLQK